MSGVLVSLYRIAPHEHPPSRFIEALINVFGTALIERIGAVPHPKLFFLMANGFDVVVIGIFHESAVVVGGIVGPEAGLAVVLAASGQSRSVKCLHAVAVLGRECHMPGSVRFTLLQPQRRCVLGPEAYHSVALVLHAKTKRAQRSNPEALAPL